MFISTSATDRKKATAIEGPADLACKGVMPIAFGRAIQQADKDEENVDVDIDDASTIFKLFQAAPEAETRATARRSQQPAITVITTLVLGLKWIRAQIRGRVDAWKSLAATSSLLPINMPLSPTASPPFTAQTD